MHTKEVLYEKYRTEKLLARRATRNISDDERQRLLEGTLIPLFATPEIYLFIRSRIMIYIYVDSFSLYTSSPYPVLQYSL